MRRRGDTQEPVTDYHDTGRPEHRKSRHVEILAKDDVTAVNRNTPTNEQELHMSHDTRTPARPANVPPRFSPVFDPNYPGEVSFYEADLLVSGNVVASATTDADNQRGIRYSLQLSLEDATDQEVRQALADVLEWWSSQESHLNGAEVAR